MMWRGQENTPISSAFEFGHPTTASEPHLQLPQSTLTTANNFDASVEADDASRGTRRESTQLHHHPPLTSTASHGYRCGGERHGQGAGGGGERSVWWGTMNSTRTHTANHTTTHGELQHQHRAQVAHAPKQTTHAHSTLLRNHAQGKGGTRRGWATRQKGCRAHGQQACCSAAQATT